MIHLKRVKGKESFSLDMRLNEKVLLETYSIGGTGYHWVPINSNPEIVVIEKQDLQESQIDIIGGEITHCYLISVKKSGEYVINFKMLREWLGEESTIDSFSIHINCKKEKE